MLGLECTLNDFEKCNLTQFFTVIAYQLCVICYICNKNIVIEIGREN